MRSEKEIEDRIKELDAIIENEKEGLQKEYDKNLRSHYEWILNEEEGK